MLRRRMERRGIRQREKRQDMWQLQLYRQEETGAWIKEVVGVESSEPK